MQRLFSTFPGGWPGAGLLLLRVAIGVTLIVQGAACLLQEQDPGVSACVVCLLAVASGVSLIVGFLTPVAGTLAVVASLGATLGLLPPGDCNFFQGNLLSFDLNVMAVATAFLGPGAFSVDALLFGRRKIIIPR